METWKMYSAASSSDTMSLGDMETNYCTWQLLQDVLTSYIKASYTYFCVANTVSSPDLIRRVYHFQYNMRNTESDPRWGWFWVWVRDYRKHQHCKNYIG